MNDTWFFWLVFFIEMTILKCPWFGQIDHIKRPYLIKLTILIWLANLLVMPTSLPTYLLT
jgi:hypothetical protein